MKYFLKLVLTVFLLLTSFPSAALAQYTPDARHYVYSLIDTSIRIDPDSTFFVEERQTYDYTGAYHQGWRTIPKNKISAITDIEVIDQETGKPFSYSGFRLNKLNPQSWGKYTTFTQDNNQIIEWYYNAENRTYTWLLRYKVHGGFEFNRTSDRLYWNIFTDYDVPVEQAAVHISLPVQVSKNLISQYAYRSSDLPINQSYDESVSVYNFSAADFSPKTAFTVDVTWPKGIVSQRAFFTDFVKLYVWYFITVLIVLFCLIAGLLYWLKTEFFARGRGTIVPEFTPPENLPPAEAEVICKERFTGKGLSATIIDLAVRGYIHIEEDKRPDITGKIISIVSIGCALIFLFIFFGLFSQYNSNFLYIFFISIFLIVYILPKLFTPRKDYLLQLSETAKSSSLKSYERELLGILFDDDAVFSTRDTRTKRDTSLYRKIQQLNEKIYKETETDTRAYEQGFSGEKTRWIIVFVMFFLACFSIPFLANSGIPWTQQIVSFVISSFSVIMLIVFIKTEARLNKEGSILKEEWLGFKKFLSVADKNIYQRKITPDMFEKYLPYAVIFGVEKQWAKAFDSLNLPPPTWYTGYYAGSIGSHPSSTSFSPSGFSASFSSSFSSAFSGSTGSGGAGGGGAGGGGGGGGGGAS